MATYVGIVHKDETTDYGICFPDFPGCISAGKTLEELQWMAEEALQFHIEGMLEDGMPIPKPMPIAQIKASALAKGAEAFILVSTPLPSKPIRVNVMMDRELLQRIDRAANNRSAFLAQAAMEALARR